MQKWRQPDKMAMSCNFRQFQVVEEDLKLFCGIDDKKWLHLICAGAKIKQKELKFHSVPCWLCGAARAPPSDYILAEKH